MKILKFHGKKTEPVMIFFIKMIEFMLTTLGKLLTITQRVDSGHRPALVMVWRGVSYGGVTQLDFCERGVNYQSNILEKAVKPLSDILFAGKN